ncbi:GldM family protein [Lewinella sp. W8]|uniref:GldM family protein n=1 Tax=Lewinella sp. W8 TaxID=2528208 RepID=UPI001067D486|nr:GldM family protein [Lewinella sp. W8]MTB52551.1 hypothetical protein [Lewinella sp. W8]
MKFTHIFFSGLLILLCVSAASNSSQFLSSTLIDDRIALMERDTVPRPTRIPDRETVPNTREGTGGTTPQPSRGANQDIVSTRFGAVTPVATKMNVVYLGLDNPIELKGLVGNAEEVLLTTSNGRITKAEDGKYYWSPKRIGPAELIVRQAGQSLTRNNFRFVVKRIPSPVAKLGSSQSGLMGSGEFRAQAGIQVEIEDFHFDTICDVVSFKMTYLANRQDAIPALNRGARFSSQSRTLINRAKPGDLYLFEDVRVKCPGDTGSRTVNAMVFKIK